MDGNVKTAEEIMVEIEDLRQIIADFGAGEMGGAVLREQLEKEIAARKLTVKELSQERNKFESMLGAMQSGITIRDLDFNITYQNEPITEVFGDRTGEKCYRAYEGRDQVCQGCPVVLAYEDGKPHTSIREVTAPSGEVQFWENTANPIRDANGKIVSCLEVCTNITKRKKSEEMLRHRYEFETLLSDITATFVDVTPEELDGRIINALEKIGRFAGIDRSYVFQFCDDGHLVDNTHEWCADGIGPQIDNLQGIEVVNELPFFTEKMQKHEVFHVPSVAELGQEASAEKEHFQLQDIKSLLVVPMVYMRRLRGFIGFDLVSEQKMWSGDDIALLKTVGVVLIGALVRKQNEDKLRQSEERFRALSEAAFEGVVFTVDGILVDANKAFLKMYDVSLEDIEGKSISETVALEHRDLVVEKIKSGYEGIYEHQGIRHDGTLIELEVQGQNIFYKGQITRMTAIRDITARKNAEREKEHLLRNLKSKNKELQSIVYTASHDLKSPLVNIDGFGGELSNHCKTLTDLLEDFDLSPDQKSRIESVLGEDIPESLRFIRKGTRKMKELLDGLLQVSRFGTADILIQPLDMNGLIKSILDTMQFQIEEQSISVSVDDLPACLGDFYQISRVFGNILDNAIKYLDPDRKGSIRVWAATENGQCTYCVEDNGIGIDKNHQDKVFEIFHRLEPEGEIPGEGLGLTISTRILDRHNGMIRLESEPGKGTKFHVTLPRA